MQEMGHTDPGLALSIYAHAMRRDEGEEMEGLGTSAQSGDADSTPVESPSEAVSRS
jgi:hypothetical protein